MTKRIEAEVSSEAGESPNKTTEFLSSKTSEAVRQAREAARREGARKQARLYC